MLPVPSHALLLSALPHASRVFAPGSPPCVAGPPAAISPGYCCPDLFVIDRSCGCSCDSGITRGDSWVRMRRRGMVYRCLRAGVWWCAGWIAAVDGGGGDGARFLRDWRRNRRGGGGCGRAVSFWRFFSLRNCIRSSYMVGSGYLDDIFLSNLDCDY